MKRGVRAGRQRVRTAPVVGRRHVVVGGAARGACREQLFGEAAEVLDERQLQHARPCPQLADRQRRDALVAVQELSELRRDQAGCRCAGSTRPQSRRRALDRRAHARRATAVRGSTCAADCGGYRSSPDVIRWKLSSSQSAADTTNCPVAHVLRQRAIRVHAGRATLSSNRGKCRARDAEGWDRRSGSRRAPGRAPRAARCSGARRAAACAPPEAGAGGPSAVSRCRGNHRARQVDSEDAS